MNGLVNIYLGGALGKAVGRTDWKLFVSSPAEALRAINVNTKGKLLKYLYEKGRNRFYKIALGRKDNPLDQEEAMRPSGQQDIYVLPVVKGRNSGLGKVLAGVAIIALIAATGGFAAGGWAMATGAGATGLGGWGVVAVGMSASLILGGITQMLTPSPNFNQDSQGESRGGNVFNGNALSVSQGGSVGLVYGRMLVTPMPVSISLSVVEGKTAGAETFAPATSTTTVDADGNIQQDISDPDPKDNLPPLLPP
jgi:predicted phage tail protein